MHPPRKRRLVVSRSMGVYLGSCVGLGFWSKLDPVGQNCAITFEDEQEIREMISTWDGLADIPSDLSYPEVTADIDHQFASIDACVAAGADAWDPNAPVVCAPVAALS